MGKPYSDDLRERVAAAIEAGHTRVKVAELYNMALSTVGGIIKRKRETGSVSPDKFGGSNKRRTLSDKVGMARYRRRHSSTSRARSRSSGTPTLTGRLAPSGESPTAMTPPSHA